MDLGLYNLKYPFRRLIGVALPALAHTDPNAISWAMLPVGAAVAACYWAGAQGRPWLWLVGTGLILMRMYLGTMDGLVATHFGKSSKSGEIINRLAPELCDVALMLALALARPAWLLPGVLALAGAWLISFAGLVGATAGLPTQSVGPAGQTDRLLLLQLLSVLAFFSETRGWRVDFLGGFLWWVAIGGALTTVLRLHRHLRAAGGTP